MGKVYVSLWVLKYKSFVSEYNEGILGIKIEEPK